MPEPITFELDADSKKQKVDEFIEWVGREYGDDMYSFFRDNYDGILENKLTQPYDHFPRGMKLSKVLMQEFGLDAETVRQHLSMLIQSNKVSGKLCLSIHPLDYLSASENNHSWRSCHAMDREYREGEDPAVKGAGVWRIPFGGRQDAGGDPDGGLLEESYGCADQRDGAYPGPGEAVYHREYPGR